MTRSLGGFTLVEIMIVIFVIAILTLLGLAGYSGTQTRANISAVKADLHAAGNYLSLYQQKNGSYPHDTVAASSGTDNNDTIRTIMQTMPVKLSKNSWRNTASNGLYVTNTTGSKFAFFAIPRDGTGGSTTLFITNDNLEPRPYTGTSPYCVPGCDARDASWLSIGEPRSNTVFSYAWTSGPNFRYWEP